MSLTVIKSRATPLTLDALYNKALELGMRVKIDSKETWSDNVVVELDYKNKNGSRFCFKGKSSNGLIEAFLNAFDEAKLVGISYE